MIDYECCINKKIPLRCSRHVNLDEGRVDAGQSSGHGTLQLRHEGQYSIANYNPVIRSNLIKGFCRALSPYRAMSV